MPESTIYAIILLKFVCRSICLPAVVRRRHVLIVVSSSVQFILALSFGDSDVFVLSS